MAFHLGTYRFVRDIFDFEGRGGGVGVGRISVSYPAFAFFENRRLPLKETFIFGQGDVHFRPFLRIAQGGVHFRGPTHGVHGGRETIRGDSKVTPESSKITYTNYIVGRS